MFPLSHLRRHSSTTEHGQAVQLSKKFLVMRYLGDSRARWQTTLREASNLADLKWLVRLQTDDNPCVSGLRSVLWKIFLLFHSTDVSTWAAILANSRSTYTSLRGRYLIYIEHPGELPVDPLSDDKNSPWNTLREDEALRAEILQDVERCMPEEEYFRRPEAQRMLLDILFVFCKMNPDVGYRQGMHELLAPILWVVEYDALGGNQAPSSEPESLRTETLNSTYIEHDSFTLFSVLMRSAKSFYELGEPGRSPAALGQANNQNAASPIIDRSKRIHESHLAQLDPELAAHLTAIDVLPQVFLIRWIRLLFGREFPFDKLLTLWDVLFAEDPALDLIDMICAAMLLRIRWQLLEADYSVALTLLLKYPSPEPPHGPSTFVEDAIYLRDNFDPAGGAKIIEKYTGKVPELIPLTPQYGVSFGGYLSPERRASRRKSSLSSPAKFLQQQGGVDAILQGAAKGVLERGERLGINKAVRDAVGEVKKNIQGLSPSASISRRNFDIISAKKAIASTERRNKQLGRMLDGALDDLRKISHSDNETEKVSEALDVVISKVQIVQSYLEDSSMPLPVEPHLNISAVAFPPKTALKSWGPGQNTTNMPAERNIPDQTKSRPVSPSKPPARRLSEVLVGSLAERLEDSDLNLLATVDVAAQKASPKSGREGPSTTRRLQTPMPARTSLAQSSFSWMLEPEETSTSATKSISPKQSSPFLGPGRRPITGNSRANAPFLFGDDVESIDAKSRKLGVQSTEEEGFNLGTIKGAIA